MKKDIWFKQKEYGWGWTPSNWKGWLTLGIWVILFVFIFVQIDKNSHSVSDTLYNAVTPLLILTAMIWAICWIKGEPPKWRWG